MNRASILLGIALAVAAAAPSRQPEKRLLHWICSRPHRWVWQSKQETIPYPMEWRKGYLTLCSLSSRTREPEDSAAEFFW